MATNFEVWKEELTLKNAAHIHRALSESYCHDCPAVDSCNLSDEEREHKDDYDHASFNPCVSAFGDWGLKEIDAVEFKECLVPYDAIPAAVGVTQDEEYAIWPPIKFPITLDTWHYQSSKEGHAIHYLFTVAKRPIPSIKKEDIRTDRGKIITVGYAEMSDLYINGDTYRIPPLEYMIIERGRDEDAYDWEGGRYISTCVNLKMDGYGRSPFEAWCDMNLNARYYMWMCFEMCDFNRERFEGIFKQDSIKNKIAKSDIPSDT